MKKIFITIMLGTTLSLTTGCNSGSTFSLQPKSQPLSTPEVEKKVNALYEKMTQEERIAQLCAYYAHYLFDEEGRLDTAKCRQAIPYGMGHFSQYACSVMVTPDSARNMVAQIQKWIKENTPNGVPALFHEEVLTGVAAYGATAYPQQIGMACSFDPALAREKTIQTARALRRIGGRLALSPMVDVVRNPYFNRLEESYGEDAYLSAAMGVAFVQGLQNGGLENGIAACSKHFLGYGGGGDASEKELMEEILLPHEAMIRIAGSKVVMTGYHSFHGKNAVTSEELMHDILRDYLGFDGMMVSDYGSISQIYSEPDPVHRVAASINAGNHVDFPIGENYRYIQQAMDEGLVSQETFENAVKRVLTLKARVGLLDENPNLYAEGHIEFDSPEERQTAYKLATESVVLLKNDGILPLKGAKKIALTGPNANNMWAMLGDYTYHAMVYFWRKLNPGDTYPPIVGLKQGLEAKMPEGFSLSYTRGCDWTEEVSKVADGGDARAAALQQLERRVEIDEEIDPAKAVRLARESDVVIAAVGENVLLCGENRDRGSLRLPGEQEAFVEKLIATGKPVVLVVFGGRAQVISSLAKKCAAVIQAWYPGEEGGNALADIIYGNVCPSGKLSVSYPAVELNEAVCYDYSAEPDVRIAWPFGHGLSYAEFEYSNLKVGGKLKASSDNIRVSFDVTNVGECTADEIVQLYVSPSDVRTQHLQPVRLQGFGRVSLAPGETKSVEFLMSAQQFGYYDKGNWTTDAGDYVIKIGASSADIRLQKSISLKGASRTMGLRSVYFSEMR